jgi:hypothetical protein
MKTTALVDTGIYAIVRHPQGGTAWLLINLGITLIAWHWTSMILGLVSMGLAYTDTFKSDRYCIEKFGDTYKHYMQKVPRVNHPAASCGASSGMSTILGAAAPKPRWPFLPPASWGASWQMQ